MYKELENNANVSYWEDVATIVRDELGKLRRLKAPAPARDGVHRAVADDVTQVLHAAAGASRQARPARDFDRVPQIFKGKTGAQLEALQAQIEQKISGRRDGVDVGYWESLLSQLKGKVRPKTRTAT